MPRTGRLDARGVLHHIMIRGIERQRIFRDIQDRDDSLERISVILPETHTSCYTWPVFLRDASLIWSAVVFRSLGGGVETVKEAEIGPVGSDEGRRGDTG